MMTEAHRKRGSGRRMGLKAVGRQKTVETVSLSLLTEFTPLKRGVNESGYFNKRAIQYRGRSGGKRIVAAMIMIHGNMPILNSSQVAIWNPITTRYAGLRVRRESRKKTMVVSNNAPNQLAAKAAHGCASQWPSSGKSLRAASQMRSGSARRSQSALNFARPAKI